MVWSGLVFCLLLSIYLAFEYTILPNYSSMNQEDTLFITPLLMMLQ